MSDFPSVLKAKILEKGLNAADAAAAIGVSAPSLRTALTGKSFPNARSLGKYASFLGLSDSDAKALIDAAKPAPGSKPKKEKKAKAGKADKADKPSKPGRKPGKNVAAKAPKAGKPGRKAKSSSSAAAAIETVVAALKQADGLLGDSLAVAVHKLAAGPRKIIESIVKSLS